MSKGIVKVTPRAPSPGRLTITVADENPYGVRVGSDLTFREPAFRVSVDQLVICTIDSATESTVTSVAVEVPEAL